MWPRNCEQRVKLLCGRGRCVDAHPKARRQPQKWRGPGDKRPCPHLASSWLAHCSMVADCWVWWVGQPGKRSLLDNKSVIAFLLFSSVASLLTHHNPLLHPSSKKRIKAAYKIKTRCFALQEVGYRSGTESSSSQCKNGNIIKYMSQQDPTKYILSSSYVIPNYFLWVRM